MQTAPALAGPLAAVDIGSNSMRLEIGQISAAASRYQRVDYLKDTVRLGAGLDSAGMLGEEATQRGLACLRRFSARLAGFDPARVRAVATQTLREAANRDTFLLRAQEVLGFPIEVISGREEARLIYAGVALLQPTRGRRLVLDIGGAVVVGFAYLFAVEDRTTHAVLVVALTTTIVLFLILVRGLSQPFAEPLQIGTRGYTRVYDLAAVMRSPSPSPAPAATPMP